jgi:hypothetical protein
MTTCEACGDEVPEGRKFCTSCGAMLAVPSPAGRPAAGAVSDCAAEDSLLWERKIPLITNPFLVLQCIGIPLGIGLFLGLVFWLVTGAQEMLLMFIVLGGFLALVFLFVMLVLQIATGGGLLTMFVISSNGVGHRAGSATRSLDRVATVGSMLAGSMGGTGAGLLALSQECTMLDWGDIRYISVYPAVRSLVFRSAWPVGPVVLYCTEDNFSRVCALVRKYAPADAARSLPR